LCQYEEQTKIYRHKTFSELWAEFKVDETNGHVLQLLNARASVKAPTIFKESTPWYTSMKGKSKTCLCTRCERLAIKFIPCKRAAQRLQVIYETLHGDFTTSDQRETVLKSLLLVIAVIGAYSKYGMVRESLKPATMSLRQEGGRY
jgi:hypothetical protein